MKKKYIYFETYPLKKYLSLKKSIKNSSTLRELTNFACIIDVRVVFHFRGVAQLCQIRKIPPKIRFCKNRQIDWSYLLLTTGWQILNVFVKSQWNQTELNLFLASFRHLKPLCAAETLLSIHKVCNNDRHDFQFPS